MTEPDADPAAAAVLAANQRFYEAFEASDIDAMSDVWSHGAEVACTHPGWATLHGWGEISSSWFALFQQPSPLQFILTAVTPVVVGEAAWVTLDENLIGPGAGRTVAALNVFRLVDGKWLMVCHHGSPVPPQLG
jgi:ketosteroid isomerase-like protein